MMIIIMTIQILLTKRILKLSLFTFLLINYVDIHLKLTVSFDLCGVLGIWTNEHEL